ncbi:MULTISPECIES: M15 family metallopeptidase [Staphylococcus]|uniref:M15 family metallopeptidase n=1 Tax=Staphylococcus TaxID=1279 RepID=UPI00062B6400|nr:MULTISPECIES: M15 family metallopeptidase [Staphylococcus]MDH9161510.1 M15 family metallopeptidase [Staphylococcus succinus]MEB8125475.1 M15 family metallopeptidase [Staphylococcus succinus]OIJ29276.1 D-alanyl-D-alanine carboxypeptidase [Staphylococcus sp. LCT-H4]PNZ19160.1 D-alanyl-D-alanine carboxypeptidase [Staphylococcus succinus subsp. succinus]RIN24964.1 D-alanyl-D-alanine carboxypeptidase family protein [Staphylococcus succinus]
MLKKWIVGIFTLIVGTIILIVTFILLILSMKQNPQSTTPEIVKPRNALPIITEKRGITRINGHVIVNKQYGLPQTYKPGENKAARYKLNQLLHKAEKEHISLKYISGYRSYDDQKQVVETYTQKDGKQTAQSYTAPPGHSEHQTGLAFDVGTDLPMKDFHKDFEKSEESKWLTQHAADYGFIIRYPKGQSQQTGYAYEPWHLRYVGHQLANIITEEDTNLESYYHLNHELK